MGISHVLTGSLGPFSSLSSRDFLHDIWRAHLMTNSLPGLSERVHDEFM